MQNNKTLRLDDVSPTRDWQQVLRSNVESNQDEFDLRTISIGDEVRVKTLNSLYKMVICEKKSAILSCDQTGRPEGLVRIQGCAFGQSSSIKPDFLFCGGSMELFFLNENIIYRTSTIMNIYHIKIDREEE
jgi:hypothetical protein